MSAIAPNPSFNDPPSAAAKMTIRSSLQVAQKHWLFLLGMLSLLVPTVVSVATQIWSTEDGSHGPIVLASGCWLIAHRWPEMRKAARPPHLRTAIAWLVPALVLYLSGRMIGVLGIEVFALLATHVILLFAFVGLTGLKALWFPIFYLGFLIPLPYALIALLTQPLKIGISEAATDFLQWFAYPVANTGVTLQVGSYELLVAAACSGLNAIISLSAIGLFYIYLLHRSSGRYAALLLMFVLPCAILANFVRVIILILITYYFGDKAAQGFLHNLAGMVTFALALAAIFAIDHLMSPVRCRLGRP